MVSIFKDFTKEELKELARFRREEGMTITQLSAKFGKSCSTVGRRLKSLGIIGQQQKAWSEADIEYARLHYKYSNKSKQEIADALGRQYYSVDYLVRRMGWQKYRSREWKKTDDEYLIEKVGQYSVPKLATDLHRTRAAVIQRIKYLKLHRKNRDGWYTTGDITGILGCSKNLVLKFINSGKLKASHRYDNERNIMWAISRDDLKRFICTYPFELQGRNCDMIQVVDIVSTNGIKYTV